MVVVDLFETETAGAWKEPGVDPKSSQVEVFHIPGAPAAEKDGSITNTMRMAQRSEEHTSELQSLAYLVCRLLLEKKKQSQRRQRHDALGRIRDSEPGKSREHE